MSEEVTRSDPRAMRSQHPLTEAGSAGDSWGASLRIAVGIASAGRPATLLRTIRYLRTILPHGTSLVVCVPDQEDAGEISHDEGVELIVGPRGLTRQRNAIIRRVQEDTDIVAFFDDDFVPDRNFIPQMERVFVEQPDIVIATGDVLADGILGVAGLDMDEALSIIRAAPRQSVRVRGVYNAYGCNMVLRLAPAVAHDIRFDERLPLYGWLEDVDFSRAIARHGRSVKVEGALGVHLGVRSGRQPGLRLGYSQIANPAYLVRKKTMTARRAIAQAGRNVLANIAGIVTADRAIDRTGRLHGNLLALADLVTGRSSPMRILDFGVAKGSRPATAKGQTS